MESPASVRRETKELGCDSQFLSLFCFSVFDLLFDLLLDLQALAASVQPSNDHRSFFSSFEFFKSSQVCSSTKKWWFLLFENVELVASLLPSSDTVAEATVPVEQEDFQTEIFNYEIQIC